jgi:hypothetical protein
VPKHKTTRPEVLDCLGSGGAKIDVITPPPVQLFSETNDNSVAIVLSYSTARVLFAGDTEVRGAHGERFMHGALIGHQGLKLQNGLT